MCNARTFIIQPIALAAGFCVIWLFICLSASASASASCEFEFELVADCPICLILISRAGCLCLGSRHLSVCRHYSYENYSARLHAGLSSKRGERNAGAELVLILGCHGNGKPELILDLGTRKTPKN